MSERALRFSELESARFGLNVIRGTMPALCEVDLLLDIITHDADVAIVRIPAGAIGVAEGLSRIGLPVLHADTLVYYGMDLDDIEPASESGGIADLATAADADALRELVSQAFAEYRSHYRANPLFAPDAIRAGYEEWALGYIAVNDDRRMTWVVRRDGVPVAFATCHCDATTGIGEIVLNGVHPTHAGHGIYGKLLRYLQRTFKKLGMRRLIVSTQVWNHAVQKVWARSGLALERAFDTWHFNTMLSAGELIVRRGLRTCPVGNVAALTELAREVGAAFPGARMVRATAGFGPNLPDSAEKCEIQLRSFTPAHSTITQVVATLRGADGRAFVLCWHDMSMEP